MTGLSLSEVKRYWVTPAAQAIGLGDPAHINIATGIGAVESGYRVMRQAGNGPALGFWQMEPATHESLWVNSLPAPCRSKIATGLRSILRGAEPDPDLMIALPIYGAAMCLARVWLAPAPFVAASDARGLCAYWKTYYNTADGAGSVDPAHVALFQAAIDA